MIPKIGDTVLVKNFNHTSLGRQCRVVSVSATGLRVTVVDPRSAAATPRAFYRKAHDPRTWVANPGAGLFGSMLNDHFSI